jgi:hypothetical protein
MLPKKRFCQVDLKKTKQHAVLPDSQAVGEPYLPGRKGQAEIPGRTRPILPGQVYPATGHAVWAEEIKKWMDEIGDWNKIIKLIKRGHEPSGAVGTLVDDFYSRTGARRHCCVFPSDIYPCREKSSGKNTMGRWNGWGKEKFAD